MKRIRHTEVETPTAVILTMERRRALLGKSKRADKEKQTLDFMLAQTRPLAEKLKQWPLA